MTFVGAALVSLCFSTAAVATTGRRRLVNNMMTKSKEWRELEIVVMSVE